MRLGCTVFICVHRWFHFVRFAEGVGAKMRGLSDLVGKLCEASVQDFYSPYAGLDWPEKLEDDAWYFSPELISLFGSEAYAHLDAQGQKRLSFHEAVNFFSLNIHGERSLIEGLAYRLYRKGNDDYTRYLHHFLDEENKHMVYFGTFCVRYAAKVYPDKKMVLPRNYAPGEEDFLFFAKVLIFEEIVDVYNKRMAADPRLHPIAREINRLHHRDESRHLAFGRRLVKELFDRHSPGWAPEVLSGVREYLGDYIRSTWQEYYNPAVYKDAGLPNPYDVQKEALSLPSCRSRHEQVSRPWLTMLLRQGILTEDPYHDD